MRQIIALFFTVLLLGFGSGSAVAADPSKVVYELDDADRVLPVLNNIRNHLKGVGGPQNVHIVLVVHGPAGKSFQDVDADPKVRDTVNGLMKDGVEFEMCRNTMNSMGIDKGDLLPGFKVAEHGGVVRIVELQGQGYSYLRP